ncbi:MAG: uracil-DNA glycosylase [Alphaproteobacteria bacterium]
MSKESHPETYGPEAPLDCALCPRLVTFREDNAAAFPDFFNAPVPSFGPDDARLLIVGMAPGLKGANQTGRPFTGDYAGDLLYATLDEFGFSTGTYDKRHDDGLELVDCMITNAVRCVPPQNKPIGAEVNACRPYLVERIAALPHLTHICALGSLAHNAVLTTLGLRKAPYKFGHNTRYELGDTGLVMISSYHCSRYNTNTGRLTAEMFADVFRAIRMELDQN